MDKVKIGFPIEYEDENNIVRNGLFLREPEIKELEKRLKEINKITDLKQQCKKQKEAIDKATNELFILKDMIYKPETREENFEIQRKISSIIKRLNGKEVSE